MTLPLPRDRQTDTQTHRRTGRMSNAPVKEADTAKDALCGCGNALRHGRSYSSLVAMVALCEEVAMAMAVAVEAAMVTQGGGGHAGGWRWARCDAGPATVSTAVLGAAPCVCAHKARPQVAPVLSQSYPRLDGASGPPQGRLTPNRRLGRLGRARCRHGPKAVLAIGSAVDCCLRLCVIINEVERNREQ